MALLVNLKARIDTCFDELAKLLPDVDEHKRRATDLIDCVLSGEPDVLSVVPEDSYGQVGSIDRFLEESRLTLGAKSYPLTPMEEMCLESARSSIEEYENQIKNEWAKMRKRAEAIRDKNVVPLPQQTQPEVRLSEPESDSELRLYEGGEMVFLDDRTEFCGAVICKENQETRRRILELLKARRADGQFIRLGCEEIASKLDISRDAVLSAVRDLRADIVEALRGVGISVGKMQVIVNERSGYHFADSVSVQESDRCPITDIEDKDGPSNVRIDDVRNVRDDAGGARRAWILQQLRDGIKLKGADVVARFGVAEKTAYRDFQGLIEEGLVEREGSTRAGSYRLVSLPAANP
jgi:biotin operon repressor